ncbi:MAG: malonic semialdehyde reductase [Alphaproteobacteria bacterium]|nr:malonic semialdehyde reductase [Alphaproteobacteria bacterium]MCD8571302.1 malonic semialdehyde reductase [Alphaproteobacteria bacterium]
MSQRQMLDDRAMDQLFREARTHSHWKPGEVNDTTLKALFDLLKMGPTSANSGPARFVFVKSKEAKEKLKPHLDAGNVDKTMAAPITALIGMDMKFYEHMGKLFPHAPDARSWFEGNDAVIKATAFRNSSLQGAYLIMAARSLGLDCGPMSGFNAEGVKQAFFPEGDVEVNFICNIGHGDDSQLFPRSPRFSFDDVCKIV